MRLVISVLLAVCGLIQANIYYIDQFCKYDYRRSSYCTCENLTFKLADNERVGVQHKLNCTHLRLIDSSFDAIPYGAVLLSKSIQRFSVYDSHLKRIQKVDFYTASRNASLTTLILERNEIRNVPSNVFELAPNLEYLSLYRNLISNLEKGCFYGLRQLRKLNLDLNELTTIEEDTFTPLKNLELIKLRQNKLRYLPANIFSQNPKLQQLHITDNELKIVDERVVTNQRALQFIMKNFNSSTNITSTALFNHSSIKRIDIGGNMLPYISSKTFARTPNLTSLVADEVSLFFVEREAFQNQGFLYTLDLSHNNLSSFDVNLPRIYGSKKITIVFLRCMTLPEIQLTNRDGWSRVEVQQDSLDCSSIHRYKRSSSEDRADICQIDPPHFYWLLWLIPVFVILLLYSVILTLYCWYYQKRVMKERLCYVVEDPDPLIARRNERRK